MSCRHLSVALLVVGTAGCGDDAPTTPPTDPDELTVVVDRPIQLTKQARIPQHDPAYERAEVTADTVIVHFSAPPIINLQVGDVIAGTGGANAYLRRVTEVTRRTARRVEVRTESAYLTDFIVDGAFTIDLKPAATSWEVDSDLKIGGKQLAVETELSIFSFGPGDGFECTPVAGGDPITIVPVLKPDFSHRMSVDITSKLWPITGELAGAEFSVDGSVEVGFELETSAAAGVQCAIDLIEYLRNGNSNALKFKRHVFFALGPIPMELTIFLEPVFKVEGTLTAGIDHLQAAATAKMSMSTGVRYGATADSGGEKVWTPIWNTGLTGNVSVTPSDDASVILSLGLKGQAGFTVGGLLYDIAGPQVTLAGYLEDKIEVNTTECTYQATAAFGAQVAVGLKLQFPVIAKEIAKVSQPFDLYKKEFANIDGMLPWCADAGVPDGGIADAAVVDASFLDGAIADAAPVDAALMDADLTDADLTGDILIAARRNGDIYRIDESTGAQTLLLDTSNGSGTDIGVVSSILWVPSQSQLWLGMGGLSLCAGCLQVLNTSTGVPSMLNADAGRVPGLALRSSTGVIYGGYGDTSGIRTYAAATGLDTDLMGGTGEGQGNGIDFAQDGTLYLTGNQSLYTVDPVTGTGTLQGAFIFSGFPAPIDVEFALPAMATRPSDGTMFVIVQDGGTVGGDGPAFIATLNPTTRVVTNIVQTDEKMDGLAFVPASLFP